MLIMTLVKAEDLQGIIFWTMGSFDEANAGLIKLMVIASLGGLGCAYIFCNDLNALSLGEEQALHLGVEVNKVKRGVFILASLLTGVSVAISGIIGFVGLAIPHLVRVFWGNDHRFNLAAGFFLGAVFMVLCDSLARTVIAPLELPVGVITGIVGGTIFIYALVARK
jgi:iron complex transport system permease protein